MARGVRKQEGEHLSATNIEKVTELLEDAKPITKKVACEMLNISYNTTRLNKIIQEHKDNVVFQKNMRKKMRTLPIDTATASQIVSGYLSGTSLADISEETYRSTNVVKRVLTKYNVPIRNTSVDYFHPIYIDNDEAIKEDYKNGDLVYSARYDCPATISRGFHTEKHGMVYNLWTHGDNRQSITQPYYELADLRKVQTELNIKMYDLESDEVKRLLWEGMKNQKKQVDKRK